MVKKLHRIIEYFRILSSSIIKRAGGNLDSQSVHDNSDSNTPGPDEETLEIYDAMRKYLVKYLNTKERGKNFWKDVEADAEDVARNYPFHFAEDLFISICEEIKNLPETRQYEAKEYRENHKSGKLW